MTVMSLPVSLFEWWIQMTATWWCGELFSYKKVQNIQTSCLSAVARCSVMVKTQVTWCDTTVKLCCHWFCDVSLIEWILSHAGSTALGMAMLVDPSLWSTVKYFDYDLMDCHDILGRQLQLQMMSPTDLGNPLAFPWAQQKGWHFFPLSEISTDCNLIWCMNE